MLEKINSTDKPGRNRLMEVKVGESGEEKKGERRDERRWKVTSEEISQLGKGYTEVTWGVDLFLDCPFPSPGFRGLLPYLQGTSCFSLG